MSAPTGDVESYRRVVRQAADEFVMAGAVVADREERDADAFALEALSDAIARLMETGVLRRERT